MYYPRLNGYTAMNQLIDWIGYLLYTFLLSQEMRDRLEEAKDKLLHKKDDLNDEGCDYNSNTSEMDTDMCHKFVEETCEEFVKRLENRLEPPPRRLNFGDQQKQPLIPRELRRSLLFSSPFVYNKYMNVMMHPLHRLTDAEKQRRKQNNLCNYCGQPGHIVKLCQKLQARRNASIPEEKNREEEWKVVRGRRFTPK